MGLNPGPQAKQYQKHMSLFYAMNTRLTLSLSWDVQSSHGVFSSWGCTVVLGCGPSPKHWKGPSSHQWWDCSSHCWDPLCPSSLGAFRSCDSAVSGPLLGLRSLGCGCCPMCLGLPPSHSSYFHILSSRYSCSLEHADFSFLPGLERSPSLWLPLQGPPFSLYFLRDT